MIKKIAIANRGEIACRVLNTCEEMGLKSVLLYSSADEQSLASRTAKEKICIGPGDPLQSYLNIPAIIEGAKSAGADSLYPGYGFLSENPELAWACKKNNILFIGPSPESLKLFGDKISARKQAKKCGLNPIPGFFAANSSQLLEGAKKIGFPVIIKAGRGGGGRGLRVVPSEKAWPEALEGALRESKQAFGSEEIFIEKYLLKARHIEVQIFGDSSGKIHYLSDRDCSVQRKHQKIIESAPVENLPQSLRNKMAVSALKLLQSVHYKQAGTVEFLYANGEFYFMELNPRLQVECPVTELILGIDLVKAQILTAMGFPAFSSRQKSFSPRGYSIQCRIYAENIKQGLPLSGRLGDCYFPTGPGRRFDLSYEAGDEIPGFYDSMIGKVIVQAEDRASTIAKMKWTLKNTAIFGVQTNINFLLDFLSQEKFINNEVDVQFVEKEFLPAWKEPSAEDLPSAALSKVRKAFPAVKNLPKKEPAKFNPWKT